MLDGYNAYRTFLGLSLHFRRGSYDGWQYNFNGKCLKETYEKNRGLGHKFSAIERKYPTKEDQLRLFYPVFKKNGFVKATDYELAVRMNKLFVRDFDELKSKLFIQELEVVAKKVKNIHELLGVYNDTPLLYDCYIEELISYDSLVILSLVIPELNKVCSEEPFLWNSLVEKIKFDSKFYMLYLDQNELKTLKQNTIATLRSAWNIQEK